jgi:hypothetical protein
MRMPSALAAVAAACLAAAPSRAAEPKPVPRLQAIPQPYDQVSFERAAREIARLHYGATLKRPFVYPLIGPAGRPITRMGHPRDPQSHSHHNSVWIAHESIGGTNFWGDSGTARIAHVRTLRMDDGDDAAFIETENAWRDKSGGTVLREFRRTRIRLLPADEWLLEIDLQMDAPGNVPVEIGQTAFGFIGVRMAKTIGVNDGGGTIRNSEGGIDEAGCFRKPARWCDYAGPLTQQASGGATLMDHPQNLNHPAPFHVRNDGWMGVASTFPGPHVIQPGAPLRLRFCVYIHAGIPDAGTLQRQWEAWARTPFEDFPSK